MLRLTSSKDARRALQAAMGVAAALVLSASSAGADGMRYSPPVAYDSWSGIYVGVNAGWGWSDTEWRGPAEFFEVNRFNASADGALYGGHVGLQKQWGALVAGVELSFDGSSMRNTKTGPVAIFPGDQFQTEVNDLFLAVGRLGFATGPWLIYGKGGWADGEVNLSANSGMPTPGTVFSVSERLDGWTVGGGVEWKLSRNFVLGLEYNYINLRNHDFHTLTTGTEPGEPINIHLDDVTVSTVMARLSFKFDDRAPTAPLK